MNIFVFTLYASLAIPLIAVWLFAIGTFVQFIQDYRSTKS